MILDVTAIYVLMCESEGEEVTFVDVIATLVLIAGMFLRQQAYTDLGLYCVGTRGIDGSSGGGAGRKSWKDGKKRKEKQKSKRKTKMKQKKVQRINEESNACLLRRV